MGDSNFKLDVQLKDLVKDDILKRMFVILSKTKSYFNRGKEELPRIKAIVHKYLKEDPSIGNYKVKVVPHFPNAYFNFGNKQFTLGLFNSSIIAHEIEHAISTKDAAIYNKILSGSKVLSDLTSKFIAPIALSTAIKKIQPDSSETVNKILDSLTISHGLTSLPTLYEEGKANLFSILSSQDKIKALKDLIPAYSTYLSKTIAPMGFYQLAKQASEDHHE